MVEGDHNSARSRFFMDSVAIFFFNTLQCDQLPHQHAVPRNPAAQRNDQSGGSLGLSAQARHDRNRGAAVDQRNQRQGSSSVAQSTVAGGGLRMQAPDRSNLFT